MHIYAYGCIFIRMYIYTYECMFMHMYIYAYGCICAAARPRVSGAPFLCILHKAIFFVQNAQKRTNVRFSLNVAYSAIIANKCSFFVHCAQKILCKEVIFCAKRRIFLVARGTQIVNKLLTKYEHLFFLCKMHKR
jgi:hypothetical protein